MNYTNLTRRRVARLEVSILVSAGTGLSMTVSCFAEDGVLHEIIMPEGRSMILIGDKVLDHDVTWRSIGKGVTGTVPATWLRARSHVAAALASGYTHEDRLSSLISTRALQNAWAVGRRELNSGSLKIRLRYDYRYSPSELGWWLNFAHPTEYPV
jgi:hypothetical protein